MSYFILSLGGAVLGAVTGWRRWPARSARRIGSAVLGGALGAALGVLQPNLFLAENGVLVSSAFYSAIGAVIGLFIGVAGAAVGSRAHS